MLNGEIQLHITGQSCSRDIFVCGIARRAAGSADSDSDPRIVPCHGSGTGIKRHVCELLHPVGHGRVGHRRRTLKAVCRRQHEPLPRSEPQRGIERGVQAKHSHFAEIHHPVYKHVVRNSHDLVFDKIQIAVARYCNLLYRSVLRQTPSDSCVNLVGNLRIQIDASVMIEIELVERGHPEYVLIRRAQKQQPVPDRLE